MNHLTDILGVLEKEEIRSYKLFSSRVQFENSDRKLLKLFDSIKSKKYHEDDPALIKLLFGNLNTNAYYRLKNRLIEDVQRSMLMHHYILDEKVKTINQILLARIFSYKGAYKQCYNFLMKAEKKAEQGSFYDLLNIIYDEILILCKSFHGVNPDPYIDKQSANSKILQKILQTNALIASLNYQLRQTNFSGKDNSVLKEINKVSRRLNIAKDIEAIPDLQFQIHDCVKNVLLFKKDFISLESYLIRALKKFTTDKLFNRENYDRKIVLLIWLINTCYKNKHFNQMNPYLDELQKSLNEFNKLFFEKYAWAYYQGKMLYLVSTNELETAISLLEEFKKQSKQTDLINYDVNIYLNLSTLYYFKNKITNANDHIAHLLTKKTYNNLSVDLRLTVDIVDLLLQIETHDYNYAEFKLKEVKRVYQKDFKKEAYQKEYHFIKIVSTFISLKQAKFKEESDKFIKTYYKLEPGSNEAINYVLWLKSKIKKENYYTLLLDELNNNTSS